MCVGPPGPLPTEEPFAVSGTWGKENHFFLFGDVVALTESSTPIHIQVALTGSGAEGGGGGGKKEEEEEEGKERRHEVGRRRIWGWVWGKLEAGNGCECDKICCVNV